MEKEGSKPEYSGMILSNEKRHLVIKEAMKNPKYEMITEEQMDNLISLSYFFGAKIITSLVEDLYYAYVYGDEMDEIEFQDCE